MLLNFPLVCVWILSATLLNFVINNKLIIQSKNKNKRVANKDFKRHRELISLIQRNFLLKEFISLNNTLTILKKSNLNLI